MIPDKTERLVFSLINEEQLPCLLSLHNKADNMRYISEGKSDWSMLELKTKYKQHQAQKSSGIGLYAIALQNNNTIIGEAGLFNSFNDKKKLELGYIIDHSYWGKGYGQEVCRALIKYAFQSLRCTSVIARMYAANTASVNVSEKCGMKLSQKGKTKAGHDFMSYKISKASHPSISF